MAEIARIPVPPDRCRPKTIIRATSARAARSMRAPEATKTGNASVMIFETGVPLPNTAIPAAK